MLTITADATEAIRELLGSREAPDSAGLRISGAPQSVNGSGPSVAIEFVPAPALDDEIILAEGAHIYLDPDLAGTLEDKMLDAALDSAGELSFSLRDQ